jgi:hypothetical protein|tara:strand:- start:2341 stop:2640 length:300 start_codon:yes stop_codon:yes gene_type:complete
METKTFVVIINVEKSVGGRNLVERLDGKEYRLEDTGDQDFIHVRNAVLDDLLELDSGFDNDALGVYPISDFVTACNDSDDDRTEIDLSKLWLGYVYLVD